MTDLRELLKQAAEGPAPASRLAADELYAAGRRRHRRRGILAGSAAAAAVLAVVAGLSAADHLVAQSQQGQPADRQDPVVRQDPRPGRSGPGAVIQWAGTADYQHIYLAYLHCERSSCRKDSFDLVGSDDGGRTWSDRATDMRALDLRVVGPQALLATKSTSELRVSAYGGRVWTGLSMRGSTNAVPDDGALACYAADWQESCHLYAVNPVAGWFSPLSAEPAFKLDSTSSIVDAGGRFWVTGTDRASGRPAVAVSADRGRTWSPHVFDELAPCTGSNCSDPTLATADGRTVYVMVRDPAGQQPIVFRSDGGRSWSRLDTGNVPHGRVAGWSFVTADGSHVICALGERGRDVDECQFWAARGGAGYQPIELHGLPTAVADVQRAPVGWYYAVSYAPTSALYGSTDGLHWSRIAGG